MEVVEVARRPRRRVRTGHSVLAGEGDVEHVGLVVAAVGALATVHAVAIAGCGEGEGGFADGGPLAVVAVGVAPYSVELEEERSECFFFPS